MGRPNYFCPLCKRARAANLEYCTECRLKLADQKRVKEGAPDRPGNPKAVINSDMYEGPHNAGFHRKGTYGERLERGFRMLRGEPMDF